jgi:hypothetical protein
MLGDIHPGYITIEGDFFYAEALYNVFVTWTVLARAGIVLWADDSSGINAWHQQ